MVSFIKKRNTAYLAVTDDINITYRWGQSLQIFWSEKKPWKCFLKMGSLPSFCQRDTHLQSYHTTHFSKFVIS